MLTAKGVTLVVAHDCFLCIMKSSIFIHSSYFDCKSAFLMVSDTQFSPAMHVFYIISISNPMCTDLHWVIRTYSEPLHILFLVATLIRRTLQTVPAV